MFYSHVPIWRLSRLQNRAIDPLATMLPSAWTPEQGFDLWQVMLGPAGLAEDDEGSELPTARRNSLFTAFSCRLCPRAWRGAAAAQPGRRSLAARWHHGVPLGRKFQKRNKNLAARPRPRCACSRQHCPPHSQSARASPTQQAKEYICFSLRQLNAISIYIQMTAIQRERLLGQELGVLCITTLFGVSVYLCYIIPVKIPVEVNNEGIFLHGH